jgi:DNA-binding NtrC family response regulator
VDVSDLPPKYKSGKTVSTDIGALEIPEGGMDFNSAVDAYENALIMKALEKTGWNRNQAAALLRLNRTTLVEKIKKKGLTPPADVTMTDR